MKTKQISFWTGDKSASEIFQSLDIKFSFVNKDLQEVSKPIKCRDFLGDCIWSRLTKCTASIYGFSYNFNNTPYDVETLRLTMKFPTIESKEYFINNISKLNDIEKVFSIKRTKVFATQDKQTLLIEASKIWQSNIWKISFYTFLLKMYSYPSVEELQSPEDEYYSTLSGKETLLMSKIKHKKEHVYDDISYAHNYSGFISLLKGSNPTTQLLNI